MILEIGLLHSRDSGWVDCPRSYTGSSKANRAPSLQMWSDFFPKSRLFGFDINDFANVHVDRCSIISGDIGNRADFQLLIREVPEGFDIIIDDASHASQHKQLALGFLYPSLAPGGIYFIEDLNGQPPEIEDRNAPKTHDLLRYFQIDRKFESPFLEIHEKIYIDDQVDTVFLCDSACPFGSELNNIDALAIISCE